MTNTIMIYDSISIPIVVRSIPMNTGVIMNVSIISFYDQIWQPFKRIADSASKASDRITAATNLAFSNSFILLNL